MNGPALAGAADGIQRMRDGVRDWVRQPAHRAGDGDGADSPAILLSRLSASAFGPLVTGEGAGADGPVLVPGGGQLLSQILTGARTRPGRDGTADAPPPDGPERAIAARIQRVLAAGNARAKTLRNQIASALKEIDAGGTAVRAALDEEDEQARTGAIAALGAIGAGFPELAFLIDDAAQAAAEIQRRLDSEAAHARVVIGRNQRQKADIRLMREELAARPGQAGAGEPAVERGGQAGARVLGCPYRGLLPFEEANAGLFYGRERLAAELAAELATRVSRGGPVIVTGVSGAGKSSLLQAGLLPILARGRQVPGSGQWPRIAMTPTTDPLAELAARLAALGGDDVLPVRDRLARHPEQAHQAVWQAVLAAAARRGEQGPAASDSARLVLIVDQFEQVFTLNTGPAGQAARRAFVTALCAAATSRAGPRHEPPALVVIAVRADFWDRCAAFPGLAAALQDGQFIVGQMTEPEFRTAITGPAASAGLSVDPALTGTILGDLSALGGDDAAGALPLLSQALALTWENREGDRLTGHGYSKTGGISHAVQTGADDIYHALSPGQQALARQLLANMTVAADGRLACRPISRKELYAGLPSAAPSQIDAVLTAFAAGRLVALHGDWAKISHDTLLRAWPRLRGWLAEDQASWVTYGQLADAAAAWHSSGDDPSLLYRGAHLAAVQQAATGWAQGPARSPAITGIQRDFLHTSERAASRTGRRRRGAVALLAVLALAVSAAFVVVFQQRNAALQQRDQAIYNQTIVEAVKFGASDTPLAAQLDLAAYRLHPTRGLASRLLDAENTPLSSPLVAGTRGVGSVAFSPARHMLASGNIDGTIRLWDVADPARPRLLGQPLKVGEAVESVAFSPDGRTLASSTYFGTVVLWDISDPAHPVALGLPLMAGSGIVYSVAFSPDGRTLASGGDDGMVRLWDVARPAHPRRLGSLTAGASAIDSVAFSPEGQTLASGSYDGAARLWNLDVGYAIEHICAAAGGLTPQQWHQYIPLSPYQPSCPR
jgi:Novel STAND NTPase 1/WD domain, G-beta repeat